MKRVLVALAILLFCGVAFSQNRWINRDFKYTHSGMQDVNYPCVQPSRPDCVHSCWNMETAVGNYVDDCRGLYTMTNNGAAVRVDDGTWPNAGGFVGGAQGMAWSFDGAADYLSRADDGSFDMDLTNNPGGDFSIQCVVTPHTVAAGERAFIGKWKVATNDRSWVLEQSGAAVTFYISDDGTAIGGHITNLSKAAALVVYRPAFITATYHYIADGSSEMYLYVDNLAAVSTALADGPIYNSASDFRIAADGDANRKYNGLIHDCKIYKGVVITEAQHDAMFAQWQGRASTFARDVVTTTTSASPPAIPFAPGVLIDQPANSAYIGSPAANSGGLYGAAAITNLVQRSSFETWAAGAPTGWTETETPGAGAATGSQDTTTMVHGGSSAKCVTTAADSSVTWDSACIDIVDTTTYYVSAWAYGGAGDDDFHIAFLTWTDDACSVGAGSVDVVGDQDVPEAWTKYGGINAAWGTTESVKVRVGFRTIATTAWTDAVQMRVGNAPTDAFCTTDAAASAVCNDTIHSILSPISANGQMSIVGTWRSPWAGTDLTTAAVLMNDGNAAAANTYTLAVSNATDEPYFNVYDNAAAVRQVAPNVLNWPADTDNQVVIRTGGNNNPGIYWNAAWDNAAGGAGTGTRNAAQATTYIGGNNTAPGDVWTRNIQFFRRMLEVIP